ncbi:hypothetical protein BS50DRAFT_621948 [Corynespora cassiicola Philippines]|uniref:RING-type domain-containing protein n=1 Tax=Corynespora cassiicola Philippines TaxID=1448308 RepID=A0A2T2NLU2_CORCC|nr:hypothetical protein BS50DRAFT_621948 [Corynespora cassiicola Philippines]
MSTGLPITLAEYSKGGIEDISTAEECSICFDDEPPQKTKVMIRPCSHKFHRDCIMEWFRTPANKRNTCPLCRCQLYIAEPINDTYHWFEAVRRRMREIIASREHEHNPYMDDLVIFHDFVERRVEQEGILLIHDMITCIKRWNEIITADPLRTRHIIRHQEGRHAAQRYEVDLNTETSTAFLNEALRGDTLSMRNLIFYEVGYCDMPNWVSAVDDIVTQWYASGYPRTNWITDPGLHCLIACAGMICLLNLSARQSVPRIIETVEYAQLLAHGDNLLLQAQREARSSPDPTEYIRLLDYPDEYAEESFSPSHFHEQRICWIVALRIRTRGRNADPLGPRPQIAT